MSDYAEHLASERIQEFIDGRLDENALGDLHKHLKSCDECRRAEQALRAIDRSLRRQTLVDTPPGFTDKVMRSLELNPGTSAAFRMLVWLAYMFAFLIVAGIVLVVFVLSGVITVEQISEGRGVVQQSWDTAANTLTLWNGAVTSWIVRYIPVGKGGVTVGLSGLLVMATLAMLDRVLAKRFPQRAQ